MSNRPPIRGVVFDVHGVLIRDDVPAAGAYRVLAEVGSLGLDVAFFTNTSARTADEVKDQLIDLKFANDGSIVMTAGSLVGAALVERRLHTCHVLRIGGGRALEHEIHIRGFESQGLADVDVSRYGAPICVVIGYTEQFTIQDAQQVLRISDRTTACIAAERDRWYTRSHGRFPGLGWVVSATESILGIEAQVVGKPSGAGLRVIAEQLACPVQSLVMVGDSVESDMAAASDAGSVSCLIGDRLRHDSPSPDVELESIQDLPEYLRYRRELELQ